MAGRRRDHPDTGRPSAARRARSGPAADHPGMANYPADEPDYRRPRRPFGFLRVILIENRNPLEPRLRLRIEALLRAD